MITLFDSYSAVVLNSILAKGIMLKISFTVWDRYCCGHSVICDVSFIFNYHKKLSARITNTKLILFSIWFRFYFFCCTIMLSNILVHYMLMLHIFCLFQQIGLQELEHGSEQFFSLRGPLCSIILIAYHTVVSYVLGKFEKPVSACLMPISLFFYILIDFKFIDSTCMLSDGFF